MTLIFSNDILLLMQNYELDYTLQIILYVCNTRAINTSKTH